MSGPPTGGRNNEYVPDEVQTFELGFKKRLQIKRFKGNVFLDIREYFQKEPGTMLPTKKGVTLTTEMWEKLF